MATVGRADRGTLCSVGGPPVKQVLLIGDSIRQGYQPFAMQELIGVAAVLGPADNGGDSANVLKHLDEWVIPAPPNLVHVNAGLHDIKRAYNSDERQVPIDRYRENVHTILTRILNETSAKVVWATMTPVNQKWHHEVKGFDRFEADVLAYNGAATEVARKLGVPVDDLFRIVTDAGRDALLTGDGVHLTEEGYRVLGKGVAACIRAALPIAVQRRPTGVARRSSGHDARS